MAQSLKQVNVPKTKGKTVTILLTAYFSAVFIMVAFSGFFIYSNITATAKEVVKVSSLEDQTIHNTLNKKQELKAEVLPAKAAK